MKWYPWFHQLHNIIVFDILHYRACNSKASEFTKQCHVKWNQTYLLNFLTNLFSNQLLWIDAKQQRSSFTYWNYFFRIIRWPTMGKHIAWKRKCTKQNILSGIWGFWPQLASMHTIRTDCAILFQSKKAYG